MSRNLGPDPAYWAPYAGPDDDDQRAARADLHPDEYPDGPPAHWPGPGVPTDFGSRHDPYQPQLDEQWDRRTCPQCQGTGQWSAVEACRTCGGTGWV
jgi:hypothetical protein